MLAANHAAYLEYQPLGVVGVIGPWNYPVFTPMGSIAYALAAGNAVVFKPSEYTPAVGAWLAAAWRAAVPDVADAFQVVTGFGDTGAALCRAGVDKLAFTGSAPTGRKVMAACAENLVPVLMELGGKDAMIVDDDADVVAAADAAVWGAMSNAGQTCIGIERVYATSAVYDRFVAEVTEQVRTLRPGSDDEATYGPMTMASQGGIVRRHIEDADGRRRPGRARGRRPEPVPERELPRAHGAARRARGLRGHPRGDLRADAVDHEGARRRGGARAGQRHLLRAGRLGVRQVEGPRARPGPPDAQRHDVGELGADLRLGAGAALRRRGRQRLRPDPRRGRAQGVHPRQGDHPPAVRRCRST